MVSLIFLGVLKLHRTQLQVPPPSIHNTTTRFLASDQLFLILYKELYYRHVYARVQVGKMCLQEEKNKLTLCRCLDSRLVLTQHFGAFRLQDKAEGNIWILQCCVCLAFRVVRNWSRDSNRTTITAICSTTF